MSRKLHAPGEEPTVPTEDSVGPRAGMDANGVEKKTSTPAGNRIPVVQTVTYSHRQVKLQDWNEIW